MIVKVNDSTNAIRYCKYWRSRFETEPPEKICSRLLTDARRDGSRVSYLLLGDFIPEDKKLREDLQKKRLVSLRSLD